MLELWHGHGGGEGDPSILATALASIPEGRLRVRRREEDGSLALIYFAQFLLLFICVTANHRPSCDPTCVSCDQIDHLTTARWDVELVMIAIDSAPLYIEAAALAAKSSGHGADVMNSR